MYNMIYTYLFLLDKMFLNQLVLYFGILFTIYLHSLRKTSYGGHKIKTISFYKNGI